MEVITSIKEMQDRVNRLRIEGKQIGFVPTMGALHEGHLSLMKQAKMDNDVLIISIFVNPIQFGQSEDYDIYPQNFEKDKELALDIGVDIIFKPEREEMYPTKCLTVIDVTMISNGLCGDSRPGHFQGVSTVVAKLFNIVKPNRAYLGQKDYQQACVIKRMVSDINFDVEIVIMPIVRDKDGLALSSRNAYLNLSEKKAALSLNKGLNKAKRLLDAGERDIDKIIFALRDTIKQEPLVKEEYIVIVDSKDLTPLVHIQGEILIALAVKIGTTRLIDNILWRETKK